MKQQIEKIDNTLITACITLLAAYVVVYSINENENFYFNIVTIFSIIFIALCFLLTLYGKYRESLRKNIFEQQKEKWAEDLNADLDRMTEDLITPQLMKMTRTILDKKENMEIIKDDPRKIKILLSDEWSIWKKDLEFPTKMFADKHSLTVKKILDDSFTGLLKEKNAALKYQLETFANKRYAIFILGLILFIVSVGIRIFN